MFMRSSFQFKIYFIDHINFSNFNKFTHTSIQIKEIVNEQKNAFKQIKKKHNYKVISDYNNIFFKLIIVKK